MAPGSTGNALAPPESRPARWVSRARARGVGAGRGCWWACRAGSSVGGVPGCSCAHPPGPGAAGVWGPVPGPWGPFGAL